MAEKHSNRYVDREASKLPFIRCKIDGSVIPVRLGIVGWAFVSATLITIGGATAFSSHMFAGETNSTNIEILNRNIGKIDEQQRATDQSVQFMVQQLQAIIRANPEIEGPSVLPKLEPSKLEALE